MTSTVISNETTTTDITEHDERRHRTRHRCDVVAEASIVNPISLLRGSLKNISEGGCLFSTRALIRLSLFSEVDLSFKIRDKAYTVRARVMNLIRGKGVGFEFVLENAETEKSVQNLIHMLQTTAPPGRP